jgi:hypothetical protein
MGNSAENDANRRLNDGVEGQAFMFAWRNVKRSMAAGEVIGEQEKAAASADRQPRSEN